MGGRGGKGKGESREGRGGGKKGKKRRKRVRKKYRVKKVDKERDKERMRVKADGDVSMNHNLSVQGSANGGSGVQLLGMDVETVNVKGPPSVREIQHPQRCRPRSEGIAGSKV